MVSEARTHTHSRDRFLGMTVTPITRRRIERFRRNRRAYWSLIVFLILFVLSLFAEFIANDKPILVRYDGKFYFPVVESVPEALWRLLPLRSGL